MEMLTCLSQDTGKGVFLLLESSVHCAHTLFWFFSFLLWPLLVCWFILLHLATKCGNFSKLVLDSYFFPTLSLSGSNMQMSSTCQYLQIHFFLRSLWAPTLKPNDVFNYFYLDVSNSQYVPDEIHDLLSFPKLIFLQDFLSTTLSTLQPGIYKSSMDLLSPSLSEPIHYQVLLVLPAGNLVTWQFLSTLSASLQSKLPSSLIWTWDK